jgi:hypothetical protein
LLAPSSSQTYEAVQQNTSLFKPSGNYGNLSWQFVVNGLKGYLGESQIPFPAGSWSFFNKINENSYRFRALIDALYHNAMG